VTAPPVEGKANQAVVEYFSKILKIPRRQISVIRGEKGRRKTLQVAALTKTELFQRLQLALSK